MRAKTDQSLERMFHPASIAIIGASADAPETGWVGLLLNFGYKGNIFPVNPKVNSILGLKTYSSIGEISYPVEYAILNIPARFTPYVMRDCVAKGVKFVHCYAAGFSETGTEAGKQLEAEITKIAKQGGIRLLGPNCMGIYSPRSGMTFDEDFPKEKGGVAFISQSGAEASRLVFLCQDVDLYFSKVVSYGNAADLDATDFLEYVTQDAGTKIVAVYVEGVNNGPRFFTAAGKCVEKKPLVIVKAGLTENGAGAAISHTASMTGVKTVWDAFFKQTGAIPAQTMDEVADIVQGLMRVKNPRGRRVAIIGRGGGIGVVATDICERAGLQVPPFSAETRRRLLQVIPEAGAGVRNPVEPKIGMEGATEFYLKGLPIVDADSETDIILIHMAIDVYGGHTPELTQNVTESAYALCAAVDSLNKPIIVALFTGGHSDTIEAVKAARKILTTAGIAVYSGVEAASRVLSKICHYYRFL